VLVLSGRIRSAAAVCGGIGLIGMVFTTLYPLGPERRPEKPARRDYYKNAYEDALARPH
jgi:hypothetical protein